MKKKTRRKLSKQLNKLIKLYGAEMALALVTGIVSALAAERSNKVAKKQKGSARKAAKAAKPPVKTIVVRKRARPA